MPIYEFKCNICNNITTQNMTVELRNKPVKCKMCGTIMKRTIGKPIIHVPEGFVMDDKVTPTDEVQEQTWRKYGVRRAGSRWV